MKKYLINIFVLAMSFGCNANVIELTILLKCNLKNDTVLLAEYNDLEFVINKDSRTYITKIEDVLYSNTFRFQSEYTIVKLSNNIHIFKNFDATFGDVIEYGIINSHGEIDTCKSVISESFSTSIVTFKRDDSGF
jgi:hypothetical protein